MATLPRRILVVRLGAIGDVTNALVVATALKAHDPTVELGWAVHDLARPLVEGHPHVDRVHVWRRGEGLAGMRAFLRDVRAPGYELALDLQRILKSALVARASRAPRVLGHDRARSKELSWVLRSESIPAGAPHAHMVEQYLDFARALGVRDAVARHVLPADEEARRSVEGRLAGLDAPLVLSVGASKPPNRWPAGRFAELARRLAGELGLPVVLAGGPEDRETFAAAVDGVRGAPGVHDWVGRTSLRELVELLRRARLFVGCDSGPMHLAAAAGARVVALFGPADPRRTGPYGPGHVVVRARPGSPDGRGPMAEIPVARAFQAVADAVAAPARS